MRHIILFIVIMIFPMAIMGYDAGKTDVSEAKKKAGQELYRNLQRTLDKQLLDAYSEVREATREVCKQSQRKCQKICLKDPIKCPDEYFYSFYPEGLAIEEYCRDSNSRSCIADWKNRGVLNATIRDVCYDHYLTRRAKIAQAYNEPYGSEERKRDATGASRWCNCIERNLKQVLTSAEIRDVVQDYSAVSDKISASPRSQNDPLWRYVNAGNACRR